MTKSRVSKGFGKPKPTETTKVWKHINWAKVQRYVFKLQKRIFQAAKSGQDAKVRWLQRLLVKSATPYDGNWTYWATRRGQAIDTPLRVAKLIKKQKGKCSWCGQYFSSTDSVEVDHIVPRSQNGKDEYKNLQLLHRHCHHEKTALDESRAVSVTMEQLN